MDYEELRKGMETAIPFLNTVGIELIELGNGTAHTRLPDAEGLHNHVGTQHAGGLFTVAEAASGGAFIGGFAERLGEITPLARSAAIDYKKLAKGPIDGFATLDGIDELLAKLDADGKVEFQIPVELKDADGQVVATATVDWHIRKNS